MKSFVCTSCIVFLAGIVVLHVRTAAGVAENETQNTKAAGGEGGTNILQVAALDEPADNSRCHVCHLNYGFDDLAVKHAKEGIGCIQCHGESSSHSSDENNVTPPDKMYPRRSITKFCLKCHESASLPEIHEPLLPGACNDMCDTNQKKQYCTDCHGSHRLEVRTRNWDKKTGKLLPVEKDSR
ncbi:MAG: cytochrome c3 family protein [Verrucomicrobia bacterium]|nr:cytochrome c3 family protein [Verrucomicrobiota bacterium]MCF7708685.1 cytochrome c3 family protein [Verrucomicrobiota bacterium]